MNFEGIDSLFANKLYASVEKRKAELVECIVNSRGISDYASYQRLVGHIAALDECLGMFPVVQEGIYKEAKR